MSKGFEKHTTPSVSNVVVDETGKEYQSIRSLAKAIGAPKSSISDKLRCGKSFKYGGHEYRLKSDNIKEQVSELIDSKDIRY